MRGKRRPRIPMLPITPSLSLDESELVFRFIRASGPGGQNVNKVSTAVELRFDARHSPSLPPSVRARALALAGKRATDEGVIVIKAQSHRTQERNRDDAVARLVELLTEAAYVPPPRKKTKPTRASKERRLEGKARRSGVKAMRGRVGPHE